MLRRKRRIMTSRTLRRHPKLHLISAGVNLSEQVEVGTDRNTRRTVAEGSSAGEIKPVVRVTDAESDPAASATPST